MPFDQMAVFLRTPQHYLGLLEHACARAGVPAYFDRGIRRPGSGRPRVHRAAVVRGRGPVGQAIRRIPVARAGAAGQSVGEPRVPSHESRATVVPRDELFASTVDDEDEPESPEDIAARSRSRFAIQTTRPSSPARCGAPWKWEELVVESAVVGGRTRADGGQRWRRRLDGLAADYRLRIDELKRDEPESARIQRFERDLKNLRHLREFALPIVDEMAAWPDRATWGEWLDRVVRAGRPRAPPARPRARDAGVAAPDGRGRTGVDRRSPRRAARSAGHARLGAAARAATAASSSARRIRRAAGRSGSSSCRASPSASCRSGRTRIRCCSTNAAPAIGGLVEQDDRKNAERLLLKLSIGAATERVYLSYPRLDVAETRARVPSFYALDVVRAITGEIPDHRQLAREAAEEAGASLAWPAPKDPARAIDDLEHDLASLKPLLESRDPASGPRPRALSARSSTSRCAGRSSAAGRAGARRGRRRTASSAWRRPSRRRSRRIVSANRPYSLSALQRFSSCPYQFLLATIYRLEPRDEPEPLVRLDPLTRGQPVSSGAGRVLPRDAESGRAAGHPRPRRRGLAEPSTPRSSAWQPSTKSCSRRRSRASGGTRSTSCGATSASGSRRWPDDPSWVPAYFEFSFGLSDEGRDERSLKDPVTIDGRFVLRGSVDLIERSPDGDTLRVTDHKTGKNRSKDGSDRRRRRHAAARAVQRRRRAGTWARRWPKAGCTTARRPAGSPITRFRSTTTTATRACRC